MSTAPMSAAEHDAPEAIPAEDIEPAPFAPAPAQYVPGWRHSRWWLFGLFLVGSAVGLLASFVLAVEALDLASNPNQIFACDINATVSCTTVAKSAQATLVGDIPNAFFGMIAYAVFVTVGVAGLARVRFPRWFMGLFQLGLLGAVGFSYWLLYESMFVIKALCPWCLSLMFATTVMTLTMLHWNALEGNLFLPARASAAWRRFIRSGLDAYASVTWVLLLVLAIILKYGQAILG